ncbi:MAG: hypothetical protein HQK78_03190 [Desulfobacterales bacterium]|nr:hypothetical protein [Desulfobacterales bacterium]
MKNYANAKEILPPIIFDAVQKHFTGILYIPVSKSISSERYSLVISLKNKGVPIRDIAQISKITIRRVRQIIKKEEKKLHGKNF